MNRLFAITALAMFVAGGAAWAEPPLVGVMSSHQFRWSDAPTAGAPAWLPKQARPKPRLAPVSFEEQFEGLGWRIVHLPVVADPTPGRWARGELADVAPLRQAGLKVISPDAPDPEALCFTFMTCLKQLDAWSRAHPGHAPVIVVAQATPAPQSNPLARISRRFGVDEPEPVASWTQIAREVQTAIPAFRRALTIEEAKGRLLVVAMGGSGERPDNPPFIVGGAGGEIDLFDGPNTTVWSLEDSAAKERPFGVLNVDWRADNAGGGVGARAARAAGAEMFVFSPEAARRPPMLAMQAEANDAVSQQPRGAAGH